MFHVQFRVRDLPLRASVICLVQGSHWSGISIPVRAAQAPWLSLAPFILARHLRHSCHDWAICFTAPGRHAVTALALPLLPHLRILGLRHPVVLFLLDEHSL